ncbi:23S rRNA (uracil(747)-C(5))-methyltransferase RlmC [Aggregatibacter actinomycetemcomitans]|uniref:23S rRNA (uracil(747)-C(5))-methyltransferase RlmC n=2 Tax=Aggregatibacter actinomycetemcomitans TaxID=714 RepID=UPI00046CFE36|nr:23S rRNA (uracil(747)-C(5))-methyltransferase RlmC [Aggregatibacter actinomycetemcomitans]QPQ79873.1 23S rRNA (uracil(747)-C(5))-methyltransferase RlmC [Aggregatibacter actinomycetemcomitans]
MIPCEHYRRGDCRSCQWLETPYAAQLEQKTAHLQQQLQGLNTSRLTWFKPFQSQPTAFRNKAKMVISGAVERPILGILPNPQAPQSAVDLCDCPLYPQRFQAIFPILKDFIARAGLVPYNVAKQKGELKHILLTESQHSHQLMLRFVLRSESKLPLIRRELPALRQKLPQLAAILEGEKEIFLTEQHTLPESFNGIPLFIRPQGFFQTNPLVAEGLYGTAQQWVQDLPINTLWDLFCGVGGFGLYCLQALQQRHTQKTLRLTGIEISASAIAAATLSAQQLGLAEQLSFQSLDAANFALTQAEKPDLIIVNPPRRGVGKTLAEFLNAMQPHFILYSSCNAETMGKDLQSLTHYQSEKIQLFDMFPHTAHYEVLVLLKLHK